MENHEHAYNQRSMQRLPQGRSHLQQPHLDFAPHTDHQSYSKPQPQTSQTQALNTPSPTDDQPPRTEGSTHAVHAQLPASFFNNAGEYVFLVYTLDLTEDTWPGIIPHCPEVFVLFGDFLRHYYTTHPHPLEPDAHWPLVTNATSLPSDDANHTHHTPTVSSTMSQPMSPPMSNENCVYCQKRKRCTIHTTKNIGPRMKPGGACEVCKKQKKRCQGATCCRAKRLVQAVRKELNAPNAASGSQEWEDSQSASLGSTHALSPTFTVIDGQILPDISMAGHASPDRSSMPPSFNTIFASSNIVPLDLDPYIGHVSSTMAPYHYPIAPISGNPISSNPASLYQNRVP